VIVRLTKSTLWLCVAVLLVACGQQKPGDADYPPLWKIESSRHSNAVWLFGTMHTMPRGKSSRLKSVQSVISRVGPRLKRPPWVSNELLSALTRSERLVIELDLNRELRNDADRLLEYVRQEMLDIGKIEPRASQLTVLQDYNFDDGILQALNDEAKRRNLSIKDLNELTLPAVLLLLSLAPNIELTTQSLPGAEDWLVAVMRLRDRRINGLEQRDRRLLAVTRVFVQSRTHRHEQIIRDYLATSLYTSDNVEADLNRIYANWVHGDSPARQRSRALFAKRFPEIYQAFISQRNDLWLEEIIRYVDSGERIFIAVGEAHLYGPDNLREMLVREGYSLLQIQ